MIKNGRCDPEIAPVLYRVLLYCVLIAVILFVVGLVYVFAVGGAIQIDLQLSLQEIVDAIASVSPEGVLGIGIAIVIITPLIRLLTTTALSLKIGDKIIAAITIFSFLAIIIAFLLKTMMV